MTGLSRLMLGPVLALVVSAANPQPTVVFPPLAAKTDAGWGRYIAAVGERVDRELKSSSGFLALDFSSSGPADRKSLLSGATVIAPMQARDAKGKEFEVKDGWVHDWRGAILLQGARLDQLFTRLQTEIPGAGRGDVLEGAIRGRSQGLGIVKTTMKIQRKYVWTFVYYTEHEVEFRQRDATHGSSRSVATRIAQLADAGTRAEHEYAAGKDDGYLLRWNSYWRYEQVPEGVIAECESVSLSKPAPYFTGLVADAIASSAARESMEAALQSLKAFAATRVTRGTLSPEPPAGTRPASSPVR